MELSNLKILIADDHTLFAEGLTYLLKEELPIESIEAVYNGKSAIGKVLNTDYDIIIMDVCRKSIRRVKAKRNRRNHIRLGSPLRASLMGVSIWK